MGVHAVRAASAREAERILRAHEVHIAVVDLGVPLDAEGGGARATEEGGPRILDLLARLHPAPPTVVIKHPRTARDDHRHLSAALRLGAFAVVDRSAVDVELLLEILRRCLRRCYADRWPRGTPPAPTTEPR